MSERVLTEVQSELAQYLESLRSDECGECFYESYLLANCEDNVIYAASVDSQLEGKNLIVMEQKFGYDGYRRIASFPLAHLTKQSLTAYLESLS